MQTERISKVSKLLISSLLLAACAPLPKTMVVEWREVEQEELIRICGHRVEYGKKAIACFNHEGGVCILRTMKIEEYTKMTGGKNDLWYYVAAGHELRHCRDGEWHP